MVTWPSLPAATISLALVANRITSLSIPTKSSDSAFRMTGTTNPFGAETARGYILGVHQFYVQQMLETEMGQQLDPPFAVETRFRYNQDFKSVYAIIPGTIMMLMVWIPSKRSTKIIPAACLICWMARSKSCTKRKPI